MLGCQYNLMDVWCFVLPFGIERGIEINQIYAVGVYPAHNVKIISNKKRPVVNVHLDCPVPVDLSPCEGRRVATIIKKMTLA